MKEKRENLVGGLILVGIGVFALLSQVTVLGDLGVYFVAALGAIFLLLGIGMREPGWIIPGGIVSGIGWGIILIEGPLQLISSTGDSEGGLFMLAFAAGWVAITILTAIFTDHTQWWALIPGAIMALIGTAVLYGGAFMNILTYAGKTWPLILIALGIYILFQANKVKEKDVKGIND